MSNSISPEETTGTKPVNGETLDLPRTDRGPLDVPDRLQDLFESIGQTSDLTFSVWRFADLSQKWSLVSQGRRTMDIDEIGRRFGGGEYRIRATWRAPGIKVGRPFNREMEFSIGEEYNQFRPEKNPEPAQPELEKVLGMAERIASIRGGGDAAGIASLVDRMMDRMDRMQERTDAKFEKILDQMNHQRQQVTNPTDQLREIMAFGKEMGIPMLANAGDSREPWLEIADMVANNVGKFLEMMAEAQKSKLARVRMMADPMARKVATVGKREMENPESRAKMIAHLDAKVGPEKTNQILEGLGIKR